tara:strand:- start:314 stop:970 length:657 start_codon:yes stop_codon:yes gene_type:complete
VLAGKILPEKKAPVSLLTGRGTSPRNAKVEQKMSAIDSKSRRVEIAIHLLTAISVVVGVFLVVLELKQTRENAFMEIIQTRMDTVIQETSLIYGENLADVLAKACHQPMTLNEAESLILHNFFTVQMHHAMKVRFLEDLRATPSGIEWQTFAAPFISRILSYPGGQSWLSSHPFYYDQEFDFGAFLRAAGVTPEYSCSSIQNRVIPKDRSPKTPMQSE